MSDEHLHSGLKDLLEPYLMTLPEKVQVAIALLQGDREHFIGAERTRAGIQFLDNRSTVFEIGSISKVFAAALLAYGVEEGQFQFDTPVQELLPFQLKQHQKDGIEITLKHLASHTSGLAHHQLPWLNFHAFLHGYPREPFRYVTQKRFERYFQRGMKLAATPGSKYIYSNLGMSLMGYAISCQNHQSYDELIQTRLFEPLGMNLSAMQVATVQEHVIPGWEKEGVRAHNWDFYALSPAGGVKTCAEDFSKLTRAQFATNSAITVTHEPAFQIDQDYAVGLGWHILDRPDGERWLNHGGGMLGYTANININIGKTCAAIVLSNLGNANDWQRKSFELSRDLLENLEASPT